jgi:hypothetical protein
MYRFDPRLKAQEVRIDGKPYARLLPDFYSVSVDHKGIEPGTIIYDPNGHVAVVYSVESDGRILFMDSHPDNSLTHGTYGKKFARSRPGMGAGFKKFRPLKLVGATKDPRTGTLVGGQVYFLADSAIPDYDTTQFFGTRPGRSWNKGSFDVNGQPTDYYEWVRIKLASGNLRFHPVEELRNMMEALCGDLNDRVAAVQTAVDNGIDRKDEPSHLPNNIYGTDGEWETFSSPSRDARLKTSFVELYQQIQEMVERYRNRDPRIDYQGHDLIGDLLGAYAQESKACVIRYKNSAGAMVPLDFEAVRRRLFALSFDPYQCVELRWGASGNELSTCSSGGNARDWYAAEQRLRNQIDRTYDVKMGFSLSDLKRRVPGSGVDNPPETDLPAYLKTVRF